LTLKSSDDPLVEQVDRLLSAFRRLRQRGFWSRFVNGGIGTLEVTYNAGTGQWHPHLHILLDGLYIPHSIVSSEWSMVTGGSFVVHVAAVHSRDDAGRYIAKYVAKPSEMVNLPPARTVELALALSGRRTLITFGTAHNVGLPVRVRRTGEEATKHVISVHHIARAYRSSKPYAVKLVELAKRHMPALVRLIAPAEAVNLPPPTDANAGTVKMIKDYLADINWWSEHNSDPIRTSGRRGMSVLGSQMLFDPRPVGLP
jgi:hypothetical protein